MLRISNSLRVRPMSDLRVADLSSLRERKGYLIRVAGEEVSLFRIGNEVFAIGNVCPHQHFSRLHEGKVDGCVVTCPMHGWSYDLRTGVSTNASGRVRRYDVEVRGGGVYIRTDGNADSTD